MRVKEFIKNKKVDYVILIKTKLEDSFKDPDLPFDRGIMWITYYMWIARFLIENHCYHLESWVDSIFQHKILFLES